MKHKSIVSVLIISLSLIALWGCPKKAAVSTAPETQQQGGAPGEAVPEEGKAEPAAQEPTAGAEEQSREAAAAAERAREAERAATAAAAAKGLKPVYFDFDKSFIRDDARAVMRENADWLKANPKVKVRIEGHCDERGTKEYNQALGQRRAASAQKYLADLGIPAGRISLISYGKEKPVCSEGTEDCWEKNRRAEFVAVQR